MDLRSQPLVVGIGYYHEVMAVKKLSIALDESVAAGAASAAERRLGRRALPLANGG